MRKLLLISSFLIFSLNALSMNQWKKDMRELRASVLELAPYIYSGNEYEKIKNHKKINKHLTKMAKVGHKLRPDILQKLDKKDPSVTYIVNLLEDDIKSAKESFSERKYTYSKEVMKSAITRCFQCHTQNYKNKQWNSSINFSNIKFLSPLEEVDLLIALRNFDKAMSVVKKELLSTKINERSPYELEGILRKFLFVSIKTNQKSGDTLSVIRKLKKKAKLPAYLKKTIESYESSLASWKKESKKSSVEEAKSLIRRGNSKKEYTYDAAAFIESLRASVILHDLLNKEVKTSSELSELYFLLGESYQNLSEPAYWDLHESYYSRCIQTNPHTAISSLCFQKFKASVEFRHSGSAGTQIPLRMKLRLHELKGLAKKTM